MLARGVSSLWDFCGPGMRARINNNVIVEICWSVSCLAF